MILKALHTISIISPFVPLKRTSANELYGALASTRRVRNQQNILRHWELGIITERRLRFRSNVRYRYACRFQMPQKLDNENHGLVQCRITRPLERLEELEMEQNFEFLNRTKEKD